MRTADLDAVVEIARLSFPDHPEDRACFENRLALYPHGCFVLAPGDGKARGYLIAYPWTADAAPPLNSCFSDLPGDAALIYLHDLAIHPEARGGGSTTAIIERLAEQSRADGWPALALSAFARKEDRDRACACGYTDYLVKPVTPGLLVEAVAALRPAAQAARAVKS